MRADVADKFQNRGNRGFAKWGLWDSHKIQRSLLALLLNTQSHNISLLTVIGLDGLVIGVDFQIDLLALIYFCGEDVVPDTCQCLLYFGV